jgi:hypothetical protein
MHSGHRQEMHVAYHLIASIRACTTLNGELASGFQSLGLDVAEHSAVDTDCHRGVKRYAFRLKESVESHCAEADGTFSHGRVLGFLQSVRAQ